MLITGNPGTGKTTVLAKVVDLLGTRGYSVGGMISQEHRQAGTRIGFVITDLLTQNRGILAHVDQETGPRLGKYRVNMADLETIGAEAIINATESCDLIAIDEIGPMELFSDKFRSAVRKALESGKPVIATIHSSSRDRLIDEMKAREDAEVFKATPINRAGLGESIAGKIASTLP
jgi:nucleoside-triphosphatase